jgi:hypothetical protein
MCRLHRTKGTAEIAATTCSAKSVITEIASALLPESQRSLYQFVSTNSILLNRMKITASPTDSCSCVTTDLT